MNHGDGRRLRHRRVPERTVGDRVVVARPHDGETLVLDGVAAVVWRLIDGWTDVDEVERSLARLYPSVADATRRGACADALEMLLDEELLEPRP